MKPLPSRPKADGVDRFDGQTMGDRDGDLVIYRLVGGPSGSGLSFSFEFSDGGKGDGGDSDVTGREHALPTRFYARKELEPVRAIALCVVMARGSCLRNLREHRWRFYSAFQDRTSKVRNATYLKLPNITPSSASCPI